MPALLIALLIAAFAFITPIPATPISAPIRPGIPAQKIEFHYVRGGIVQINPDTNSTRFIPYRYAKEYDRRAAGQST